MKIRGVILALSIGGLSVAQNPGKVGTANLTAWFMPDALPLGNVLTWTTTFPTGAGATTVTDGTAPYPQATNVPAGDISNYNMTLEFTGNTNTNLQALQNTTSLDLLDNASAGDEGTFFGCYYLPATTQNDHMMLYNESGNDAIQFRNLGVVGRFAIGKGLGTSTNASRDWTEQLIPTIISYRGNRSGVGTMSTFESSLLFTGGGASQSSGQTGLHFGVMPGNNNSPYNGYLHEFIFYNRDLTLNEMLKVNTYLAVKYGVTLQNTGGGIQGDYMATNDVTIWDADLTPNYHNNVIGIGRDDSTGLLQKQSHTFDDLARLYISTLQTTNAGNTGVITTDTSYVMMGHDQGVRCATVASNAEVPAAANLYSRIEREWKLTKTNFTEDINLDIQLAACATLVNFDYNCLRLLVDDDGDFTDATVYTAGAGLGLAYNNGIVTVTGITDAMIPNNSTRYVTLGSVVLQAADLGNDTTLCQGQNLTLDATTVGATYLWQDNSTNPTFNVTQQGTYWVEISNNNCTTTDSIIVGSAFPTANLGNDTTLCQGDTLHLDVTIANASYLWQDNSTDSAFTVQQAGQYWVEVTESGCVASDTINVAYNALPVVNLGNDTALCVGDNLLLDVTTAGASYLWQDNSTNPTFNVTQTGTYHVTTTLNNCSSADTVDVLFNPIPLVDLGGDAAICVGGLTNLNASTVGATYVWQDGSTNPTFPADSPGVYHVAVTVNGCTGYDTVTITNHPPLQITIDPVPDACEGEEITFTHNVSQAQNLIATSLWSFGDGWESSIYFPPHAYTDAGTYNVNLNVTSVYGCTGQASTTVTVIANPVADFSISPENPVKDQEITFNNLTTNATIWLWTFGDGSGSDEENPLHVYETPFLYEVIQIAYNMGCTDTARKSVLILDELIFYVPNAFTPDASGFNETFKPVFTSGFNPYDYRLTIYNRWGEILFESYDADIGWNGTYGANTGIVQAGTYVWSIRYGNQTDDQKSVVSGYVTILR